MYAEFLDKRFQMYENYRIRMIILPSLVIMPTKRQAWCMLFWHLRRLISFNFLSWSGNKKGNAPSHLTSLQPVLLVERLRWKLNFQNNLTDSTILFKRNIGWIAQICILRRGSILLTWLIFWHFLVWNFDWNYLKITVTTNNCSTLSDLLNFSSSAITRSILKSYRMHDIPTNLSCTSCLLVNMVNIC